MICAVRCVRIFVEGVRIHAKRLPGSSSDATIASIEPIQYMFTSADRHFAPEWIAGCAIFNNVEYGAFPRVASWKRKLKKK